MRSLDFASAAALCPSMRLIFNLSNSAALFLSKQATKCQTVVLLIAMRKTAEQTIFALFVTSQRNGG